MDEALWHARSVGLRVKYRDLGERHGELRSSGVILLHPDRPVRVQRETLLHECGHHVLCHDRRRGRWSPAHERAADLYAARLLISPIQYAIAEEMAGADPRTIARELDVTLRMVLAYQAHHERRGRAMRMDDDAA